MKGSDMLAKSRSEPPEIAPVLYFVPLPVCIE